MGRNFLKFWFLVVVLGLSLILAGCQGMTGGSNANGSPGGNGTSSAIALTVTLSGAQTGTVSSSPSGIDCGPTCSANFQAGSTVTLNAKPLAGSSFAGWSGACSGTGACTISTGGTQSVSANFSGSLQSINHIVFLVQENRSFDHYFGALREYWAQNGFPDQAFDGLPQFNNPAGAAASNPGCDAAFPFQASPAPFNDCKIDTSSQPVTSYHLITQCVENPSPSWNEAHSDWNVSNPVSPTPTMDGFVHTAGHDVRETQYVPGSNPPESDYDGIRAMGYYDGTDLPYYYFMASSFATSDRWFSPVMSRTQLNREYLMAGTSLGHAYPPSGSGEDVGGPAQFTNKTIFQELQDSNIPWRIYVSDSSFGGTLQSHTELGMYTFANSHSSNFVPATQFLTDIQNGTLPAVSEIDPGFASGTDEHAEQDDSHPGGKIQKGAQYAASLINALMASPSWKDTVFILTYDEFGGFYDHVPPQATVSPDGIKPIDLLPGDICTNTTGPTCDFVYTGYRVPLIVISPFSKKNYVSHTTADYTAILKLIETRFGVSNLTARDAAQMDMSEFFDFNNAPWVTPPTNAPAQPNSDPCYMNQLP